MEVNSTNNYWNIACGIIIIIKYTEALSVDQVSKCADTNMTFRPVEAF